MPPQKLKKLDKYKIIGVATKLHLWKAGEDHVHHETFNQLRKIIQDHQKTFRNVEIETPHLKVYFEARMAYEGYPYLQAISREKTIQYLIVFGPELGIDLKEVTHFEVLASSEDTYLMLYFRGGKNGRAFIHYRSETRPPVVRKKPLRKRIDTLESIASLIPEAMEGEFPEDAVDDLNAVIQILEQSAPKET